MLAPERRKGLTLRARAEPTYHVACACETPYLRRLARLSRTSAYFANQYLERHPLEFRIAVSDFAVETDLGEFQFGTQHRYGHSDSAVSVVLDQEHALRQTGDMIEIVVAGFQEEQDLLFGMQQADAL